MSVRSDELDEATVVRLVEDIHDALEAHYERSRGGQISVYEALSGLAIVAAVTLKATKLDPKAVMFFSEALATNTKEVMEDLDDEEPKPH